MTNKNKMTRAEKNMLWSNIKNTTIKKERPVQTPSPLPRAPFIFQFKFALASFLIIMLLGSSAGIVFASDSSVPGDTLFPIDIAIEKIQLVFSRGNKKDTLRVKFAEERLEEVKIVLAISNQNVFIQSDTNEEESTVAKENNSNKQKKTSSNIVKAGNALVMALEHLEKERDKLLAQGNESAAAVIDDIILELSGLALNHLNELGTVVIHDNEDGDEDNEEIKLVVTVSSNAIKNKFKFGNNGRGNGNGRPSFVAQNDDGEDGGSNDVEEDDDEDGNEDDEGAEEDGNEDDEGAEEDGDSSNNNNRGHQGRTKIEVCHKNEKTLHIASAAARAHLAHGDILGSCDSEGNTDGEEDDDVPPDESAPVISNLSADASMTTALVQWDTDEVADENVWYSLTTPVDISGEAQVNSATFVASHSVSLTDLTASTTYYVVVSAADESGNMATSSEISFTTLTETTEEPADETAPVISNLSTTAATTTATIEWDTDEVADSKVWYSTTTPVEPENDPFVISNTLITSHALSLIDLSPLTTYYIVVSSTDEADNETVSSETSFTTLAEEVADVTPPVISDILETNITTSSTEISWTTDEAATSKVWYSTTTPIVVTNETLFEEDISLVESHSLTLSGLTASTTYYYLVSSTDEADNIETSSEASFTTLP